MAELETLQAELREGKEFHLKPKVDGAGIFWCTVLPIVFMIVPIVLDAPAPVMFVSLGAGVVLVLGIVSLVVQSKEILVLTPKYMEVQNGFKARKIDWNGVHDVEFYKEDIWYGPIPVGTDYKAKIILKTGNKVKRSIKRWSTL